MSRNSNSNSISNKHCTVCKLAGLPADIVRSHFVRETPDPLSPVTCPLILNNECSYCHKVGHLPSTCPAIANLKREKKNDDKEYRRIQFEATTKKAKTNSAIQSKSIFAAAFEETTSSDSESDERLKRTTAKNKVRKTPKEPEEPQPKKSKHDNPIELTMSNFPTMAGSYIPQLNVPREEQDSWAKLAAKPVQKIVIVEKKTGIPIQPNIQTLVNTPIEKAEITDSWDMEIPEPVSAAPTKMIPDFSIFKKSKKIINWADDSDSDSD